MKLSDRIAVVTGASMGIGEAIASLFAAEGATVVVSSRDLGRCETARQRIGHLERTFAHPCDVRNRSQIDALVDDVLVRYGRIDLWINNAGFGVMDSLAAMRMQDGRTLFDTNFFGAIECFQSVVPAMKRQHSGTIVNISSVAGHIALPYMAAYCASKSALNAFSYAARMELRGSGINVVNVCPGFIATDFGRNEIKGAGFRKVSGSAPRGVPPERVARAVMRGILRHKREVVVPWFYRPLIQAYKLFPTVIDALVAKRFQRDYGAAE